MASSITSGAATLLRKYLPGAACDSATSMLPGQMHDGVHAGQGLFQHRVVSHPTYDQTRPRVDGLGSAFLERIEDDDLVTGIEESAGGYRSYIACSARDQQPHSSSTRRLIGSAPDRGSNLPSREARKGWLCGGTCSSRGYTDAKMELDNAHIGDEAEASPASEEPAPSQGAQDETTPAPCATLAGRSVAPGSAGSPTSPMIIAGVLLLAYPLGTWAYTWYEQRGLREQLESENPGMVVSSSGLRSEDFISVEERAANAEQSSAAAASAAASAAERAAAEAAILAAEQEHQAQLDAFEAAAHCLRRAVERHRGASP